MQHRHPQRRQLVQSWQLYVQQHAAVFAAVRVALFMLMALLGVFLFQHRATWTKQSALTVSWLDRRSGEPALTCTESVEPLRRMCLAHKACHSAAATAAVRRRTGSQTAISLDIPSADSTSAHTVKAHGGGNLIEFVGVDACDSSTCKGAAALLHQDLPTVFTTGSMLTVQRPGLPFIFQLQQLFAALMHFQLEEKSFQVVVVDDVDIDRLHPAFEAVSGRKPVLLSALPRCFRIGPAVVISAAFLPTLPVEASISAKEASAVRPAFPAFATWLLMRVGVEHPLTPAKTAILSKQGGVKAMGRRPNSGEAATGAGHAVGGKAAPVLTVAVQGLSDTQALMSAGRACGFTVQAVDMQALSFGQQLQVVANSSVYVCAHGDSAASLLALPPEAVVVQLMHGSYGRVQNQDHAVANLAAVMQRAVVVWHDRNQACASGKVGAGSTRTPQVGGCVHDAMLVQENDATLLMKAVLDMMAQKLLQPHENLLLDLNVAVTT